MGTCCGHTICSAVVGAILCMEWLLMGMIDRVMHVVRQIRPIRPRELQRKVLSGLHLRSGCDCLSAVLSCLAGPAVPAAACDPAPQRGPPAATHDEAHWRLPQTTSAEPRNHTRVTTYCIAHNSLSRRDGAAHLTCRRLRRRLAALALHCNDSSSSRGSYSTR